jgi:hypothetical protein
LMFILNMIKTQGCYFSNNKNKDYTKQNSTVGINNDHAN